MEQDSKLYRLEELVDQIVESIDNIDKLIKETNELNEVLNKYAKRKFKNFIKAQDEQVKTLQLKKDELSIKLDNIKIIIDTARNDEEKCAFLDLVLNTLIQF